MKVEGGARGVVGLGGLHALAAFADAVGWPAALSAAIPRVGERAPIHDRGVVLTHAMLMLAGGGEAVADIEHLRSEPELFGAVASDSTLYRTLTGMSEGIRSSVGEAVGSVRERVWERLGLCDSDDTVVLDVDATLVDVHSQNKQDTAATYRGGFGFHPMLCFADATGEPLAARLRPGNAAANQLTDLLGVLDDAVAVLPVTIRTGHQPGDSTAGRRIMVRSDSAGGTASFATGCRTRNIGFAVVARSNAQITAAIEQIPEDRWQPAKRAKGDRSRRSFVAEITDLVDLSDWPTGTRLIVRREPLHAGAQRSLFPHFMYRFWGHYTDQHGDPAERDAHIRAHAHVEENIKRLKDSGLCRFPFTKTSHNAAWLAVVIHAAALVRWFQLECFTGALAKAHPKALRWELFHAPARIIRKARRVTLRFIDSYASTDAIITAYQRIALIT